MGNRIFIEDLPVKMSGKKEREIGPRETIRFEFEDTEISVKIRDNALEVYKINRSGLKTDVITVMPCATNKIIVK